MSLGQQENGSIEPEENDHGQTTGRYDGSEETVGTVDEMLENLEKGIGQASIAIGIGYATMVGEVAAVHGSLPCSPPSEFEPLFQLLHTTGSLATAAGVALGAISIMVAGVLYAAPGQDNTQRGKGVAKNGILGVGILLSAGMVVAFLVNQLGASLC
jgi:hypothetical protein